jgi:hypothetical protein
MRYGLDSFLPEGAFEHYGDRRIRLYGGGGGIVGAVSKAVSDVGNAIATVGKQVGDVVTHDVAVIGDIGTNLAHGQIGGALKAAVGGVIGDVGILTGGSAQPKQAPQQQQQGQSTGTQTLTTGNPSQKSTSLNDQSVLGAPQGAGSLTTCTVSGPDNTYKLDKSTMLGL